MKIRTTAILMIALTVWFIASIAAAQTKPDFSGDWKLNFAKSNFQAVDDIRNIVFNIKHKDPDFSETVIVTRSSGDQTIELKWTTDGKESDVKQSSGSVKVTAKWEGDALIVEQKSQTGAVLNRTKYTLSADVKTLTVTTQYFASTGEVGETGVFEKQ